MTDYTVIDRLSKMQIREITAMPIESLAIWQKKINRICEKAEMAREWMNSAILIKYHDSIADECAKAGKDTDDFNLNDGDYIVQIKIIRKKKE